MAAPNFLTQNFNDEEDEDDDFNPVPAAGSDDEADVEVEEKSQVAEQPSGAGRRPEGNDINDQTSAKVEGTHSRANSEGMGDRHKDEDGQEEDELNGDYGEDDEGEGEDLNGNVHDEEDDDGEEDDEEAISVRSSSFKLVRLHDDAVLTLT